MVILLCYTSAFNEVIYADFYAKILEWNFRIVDENSLILVVVFVSKLNSNFSFRFVHENYRIYLFSSTKIFVFVVVKDKNIDPNHSPHSCARPPSACGSKFSSTKNTRLRASFPE